MNASGETKQVGNPAFFDFLSPSDQKRYHELRSVLSSAENKYKRNQRVQTFQNAIDMIKEFCCRGDEDDWKRYLVCGICWFDMDIAINTRQLRLLIDKCKSSINGALAKMGYGSEIIRGEGSQSLISKIPFLKGNFVEQRQWTIRKRITASPYPAMFVYSPFFGYAMVTPQPQLMTPLQVTKFSQAAEQRMIFGVPQMMPVEKSITPTSTSASEQSPEPSNETPSPELTPEVQDTQMWGDNFTCDPCCCCPIEWPSDTEDDMIAWG